jgi:hypothetical protein
VTKSKRAIISQDREVFKKLRLSIDRFFRWKEEIFDWDELLSELLIRYAKDADKEQRAMLEALCRYCKGRGARLISISEYDFIIFEGLRGTDKWPLTWSIVRDLGIDFGCGNGGQHQIRFPELRRHSGIYDIRGSEPVRICNAISLNDFRTNSSEKWNTEEQTASEYLNAHCISNRRSNT